MGFGNRERAKNSNIKKKGYGEFCLWVLAEEIQLLLSDADLFSGEIGKRTVDLDLEDLVLFFYPVDDLIP